MNINAEIKPANNRELVLTRVLNATPAQLFKAWTTPEILKEWFMPKPYELALVDMEPRDGGKFRTVMTGPDGFHMDSTGVFLKVEKDRRIITTDAFGPDWKPTEKAFFSAEILFDDLGNGQTLHRHRPPLDRGGLRSAREDGLPRRLGTGGNAAGRGGVESLSRGFPCLA